MIPVPLFLLAATALMPCGALAQDRGDMPETSDRPMHYESARQHEGEPPSVENPPVPEGMTLEEAFKYAETPPPSDYPRTVPDDRVYVFTFIEQLEYRLEADDASDHLGWEAQGWVGKDFHKFWWKQEGEAVFEGTDEGESETDLLYSRLITPFWNLQAGVQYANGWEGGSYEDRWSAVAGVQGLAPYKFELDNALYLSEDGDVTVEFEGEYDLRITQRLVLQPRAELAVAAQDISERSLGAGLTDVSLDLRLRYEIRREFAPYVGIRYRTLTGETEDIADAAGQESDFLYFMGGLRFAF
ncbi:copper resistance protein B [Thiohalobacter sp. COW1]|uniref:copper resistance protein B n=1 Tax=Thiohalobacter sp. COW1 TaxID=2795687 RepID=UPI0019169A92|nr:copper resistance protein B [Thiohalobacter sp. COW1]